MDPMIMEVFTPEDLLEVEEHLRDLTDLATIDDSIYQACDCSFLYFYRDLFPSFLGALYDTSMNSDLGRVQLVLSAMSDPERIIKDVQHLERDQSSGLTSCYTGYQNYLLSVVKVRLQ